MKHCVTDSGIIEESPKWHLLSMVLGEIRKESATNTKSELCPQSNIILKRVGGQGALCSIVSVCKMNHIELVHQAIIGQILITSIY